MGPMLAFGMLAFLGAATITAALWDYRLRKDRPSREWRETTSTTMVSGKTRHLILTYKADQ